MRRKISISIKIILRDEPFAIDDGLDIGIGIFSIILFVLVITTYRNTKIEKILFVAAVFGLFAIQLLVMPQKVCLN